MKLMRSLNTNYYAYIGMLVDIKTNYRRRLNQKMSITVRFKRTLWRSGGSMVVSIPPELLEAYGIREGDNLEVYSKNGSIAIEKAGEP